VAWRLSLGFDGKEKVEKHRTRGGEEDAAIQEQLRGIGSAQRAGVSRSAARPRLIETATMMALFVPW